MSLQLSRRVWVAAAILGTFGCGQNPASTTAIPSEPSQRDASASPTISAKGSGTPARAEVSLTGAIASVNTAGLSLVVGTTTVSVPSTAMISRGRTSLAFADLAVGDRVSVRGTLSGQTIVADEVVVLFEPNAARAVTLEGVVSARAGTCPAATFTVRSISVAASSTTTYSGGTCSTLANDLRIVVRGTRPDAGGVVTASSIQIEPARADGVVSGLSGACPAVTFTDRGIKVTTTSATVFRGRSCAGLANGLTVEVDGVKQADGSIAASSVEIVPRGHVRSADTTAKLVNPMGLVNPLNQTNPLNLLNPFSPASALNPFKTH
jgi:hypothetical protein